MVFLVLFWWCLVVFGGVWWFVGCGLWLWLWLWLWLLLLLLLLMLLVLGTWPFSCRGTWSRATHAVPLGVGIHTWHVSTQFMFFFLSVVYRLSHWHASFHTHTLKWFVVLAMQKHIVTAYKMQFSTKARKNRTHWHTEHVVCFLCTCFWQSSCNHTNTTCIGTALFSTSLSFISCLASPKQQKQNAQAQRQNPCNCLCTCSFL